MHASSGLGKCSRIRHIVRLRQMLLRWRAKARMSSLVDVPSGHVVVRVGADLRRVVVRATYLNHPMFRKLLTRAEEFGFDVQGPLTIPCDERSSRAWSGSSLGRSRGWSICRTSSCTTTATATSDRRVVWPGSGMAGRCFAGFAHKTV